MASLMKIAKGAAAAWAGVKLYRWYRQLKYDFTGRVAIITGGSRGLGLNLSRQLAEQGARLAILARDKGELDRAVEDLSRYHGEIAAFPCDISKPDEVCNTISQVMDRFGRIDVLINNAGVIQVGPFDHMTDEDFRSALDVYLWGPLHLVQAVIPHMRRQGEGRIVNISSIGGRIAVPHLAPYVASKFALTGLSDALRAELGRDGIRVTTVIPGLMRTGSPPNAWFKGRHGEEFGWFMVFDSLPILSTSAHRAARKILGACQRGDAQLVLTLPAKVALVAHALFPEQVAMGMSLMNRLLPEPSLLHGTESHKGMDTHSRWAPSALTTLSDRAAKENNELP